MDDQHPNTQARTTSPLDSLSNLRRCTLMGPGVSTTTTPPPLPEHLLLYGEQCGCDIKQCRSEDDAITAILAHIEETFPATGDVGDSDSSIDDVLANIPSSQWLHRQPLPHYLSLLLKRPAKMEELVHAAIAMLSDISITCDPTAMARLASWLEKLTAQAQSLLRAEATTPRICGYVFEDNDPVVRCSKCGTDSSCVMCLECFLHSPCVHHPHKISLSRAGGFCDCGVSSAWDPNSFCIRHRAGDTSGDPIEALPPNTKSFAVQAVRLLTSTAVHMLLTLGDKNSATNFFQTTTLVDAVIGLLNELSTGVTDCPRRVMCLGWLEDVPQDTHSDDEDSPAKAVSSLELFVRFSANMGSISWDSIPAAAKLVGAILSHLSACVTDPFFKLPLGALLTTYAEGVAKCDYPTPKLVLCADNLRSQVFLCTATVPKTLRHTCLTGRRCPLPHRWICACLYGLYALRQKDLARSDSWAFGITTGDMGDDAFKPMDALNNLLVTSTDVAAVLLISTPLLRAFCAMMDAMASSSSITHPKLGDHTTLTRNLTQDTSFYFLSSRFMSYSVPALQQQLDWVWSGMAILPADVLESLAACRGLDGTSVCPTQEGFEEMLQSIALSDGESSLMVHVGGADADTSNLDGGQRAFEFLVDVVTEVAQNLRLSLAAQKRRYRRGGSVEEVTLRLGSAEVHVSSYELLPPQCHSVTLSQPICHLLTLCLQSWALVVSQQGSSSSAFGGVPSPVSLRLHSSSLDSASSSSTPAYDPRHPLLSVSRAVLSSDLSLCLATLDALVMPFVLSSQIQEREWRMDTDMHAAVATHLDTTGAMGLQMDLYLLRSLTMSVHPELYARHVWTRFGHIRAEPCAHAVNVTFFLLSVLMHADTPISAVSGQLTLGGVRQAVENIVLHTLALRYECPHSALRTIVRSQLFLSEKEELCAAAIDEALTTHATVRSVARQGNVFRLKSSSVFETHINAFSISQNPSRILFLMQSVYERLRRLEDVERNAKPSKKSAASNANTYYGLPPPQLDGMSQIREHVPFVRDLLHTSAFLHAALDVVVHYHAVKVLERADTEALSEHSLTEAALFSAVAGLYLCVKDCAAISKEMCRDRQQEPNSPADAASSALSGPPVDWDLVAEYMQAHVLPRAEYVGIADYGSPLPLPELLGAVTVKQKLHVELHMLDNGATLIDVLRDLHKRFRADASLDKYSIAAMIEFVASVVGVTGFGEEERMASEKERLLKRQRKLLQRLQKRSALEVDKALAANSNAAPRTAEPDDDGDAGDASSDGSSDDESVVALTTTDDGFVLHTVDQSMAFSECCLCQVRNSSPLYLLGRTSTSRVLGQVKSVELPDKRTVHAVYAVCRHRVHRECRDLLLAHDRRRGRDHNPGETGEVVCPMCMMMSNCLSPVPQLPSASEDGGEAAYFVGLRAEVAGSDVCTDLHMAVAMSGVGGMPSAAPETVVASLSPRDAALYSQHSAGAWALLETIRAMSMQMHLCMEAVKIGVDVDGRVLLPILSLLVSVSETTLREHGDVVRSHLAESGEDLCVLVLDALTQPQQASSLVADYVLALLNSVEHTAVSHLLRLAMEGSSSLGTAEEDAEAAIHVALWKEVGCAAVLKALVVSNGPVSGIMTKEGSGLRVPPLTSDALLSPSATSAAVVRMLHYLLIPESVSVQDDEKSGWSAGSSSLAMAAEEVTARWAGVQAVGTSLQTRRAPMHCSTAFHSQKQWMVHLLESCLGLPTSYTTALQRYVANKMCSACSSLADTPMMCCTCGKVFCEGSESHPSLVHHVGTCTGSTCIFLSVFTSELIAADRQYSRRTVHASIYADERGESLQRCNNYALTLSDDAAARFLRVWLLHRWSVDSMCVRSHMSQERRARTHPSRLLIGQAQAQDALPPVEVNIEYLSHSPLFSPLSCFFSFVLFLLFFLLCFFFCVFSFVFFSFVFFFCFFFCFFSLFSRIYHPV